MTSAEILQAFETALRFYDGGRAIDAEPLCRWILGSVPSHAGALHLLGLIEHRKGNNEVAIDLMCRAIAREPRAEYFVNLGVVLTAAGRAAEAVGSYQRALELAPNRAEPWANLGNALRNLGDLHGAIAAYQKADALQSGNPAIKSNLGVVLKDVGRFDDAIEAFRGALAIWPDRAPIWNNLGNALRGKGELDAAAAAFRRALELQPTHASAWSNLGVVHLDAARHAQAVECYQRAIEIQPASPVHHSNLVYAMHFDERHDAAAIYREHVRWRQRHADPLKPLIQPHLNDRSPERRLRIAYVSPDLREHVIGRFMLPLIENHDSQAFEIFCYSDGSRAPDQISEQLRRHAGVWRTTGGLTDDRMADLIREDRIDVLVDLCMHMAGNRLLVFARKPAPVQVTYLAYCSTTGLDTIDYRITDPYLDHSTVSGRLEEPQYSEKSVPLPRCYWCYQPPMELREPDSPPMTDQGHATFGCLNNFSKVTPTSLRVWAHLMREVPDSRLLLHAREGSHRRDTCDVFSRHGIDPVRLSFIGPLPLDQYFDQYRRIEIALDPFPYAGGTTTCDALWMGVPVVTLAGRTAVGRGGVSILSNVGLRELIAPDEAAYIRIAAELAGDLRRLTEVRSTLRGRMRRSPLMDGAAFARDMEAAFRMMWRKWCAADVTAA